MKTQLFIEDFEIELNESVQFLLNKEFEELSNPTIIINDWSKTISIPFTEKNNRTFGYIYKPEKVVVSNGSDSYKQMQQYFDPTKKLDFRLIYNTTEIMQGYAKMNDIKMTGNKGTYNITLFGQLGKIFQELKKITFDVTTDDPTYLIDGSTWVDEEINRTIVYDSWTSSGQQIQSLQPKYIIPGPGASPVSNPDYHLTDIIGFAPNNAFSNDFDHQTMQVASNETRTFEEYLGDNFKDKTGIDINQVIPNGITPRGFGEFRSYLQLPFIYWNKLFQVFQNKAEALTGYTFDLDESFFKYNNPYWYQLVYMLKPFSSKPVNTYTNRYNLGWGTDSLYWGSADWGNLKSAGISPYIPIGGHYDEEIPIYYAVSIGSTIAMSFNTAEYSSHLDETFNLSFKYLTFHKNGTYRNTKLGPDNGFYIKFSVTERKESGAEINSFAVFICASNYTGTVPVGVNEVIKVDTVSTRSQSGGYDWSTIPFSVTAHLYIPPQSNANLKISGRWVNTTIPFVQEDGSPCTGTDPIYLPMIYLNNQTTEKKLILSNEKRSGDKFILNDLWNNDFNLFDEVIKYCKMMRIYISVDNYAKKIYFIPYNRYFQYYNITDWTDKVDRSKEMIIKPITFENKYVLFNYKDSDTDLGKTYREKYGFDFGEYRLTTDYNFNTETKELFDKIPTSIVNTDHTLSLTNLALGNILYSFPNETFIYNKDKEGKNVDIFGQFYFHNGLANFNNETMLKLVYPVGISDDTKLQKNYQRYFYTFGYSFSNKTSCTTYPNLDVVYGNNMILFNIPKENFTYNNNYAGKTTLYTRYWKNYLDERYSIQNKLVTCYITLTPTDWMNFEFNHFIMIDGIIYMVNKIYDYNIEVPEATKVDLISITNTSGYTS